MTARTPHCWMAPEASRFATCSGARCSARRSSICCKPNRSGRSLLLFFIDVNGLKEINDVFGHAEGDAALKCTAEALETTFRDSDLLARFGGDEFAALAIEASGQSEAAIRDRLTEYLNSKRRKDSNYEFSVSLGTARFDPWNSASLRELIAEADRAMYEQKRRNSRRLNAACCPPS